MEHETAGVVICRWSTSLCEWSLRKRPTHSDSINLRLSGYKINISKSKYFPINQLAADILPSTIPFKIANTAFKYLGIVITRSLRMTREQNVTLFTAKVKSDLQRWSYLLLLAGRIQMIKMNVLPRYLYVFQHLPIFLPKSFFTAVNKIISSFIWTAKSWSFTSLWR